MAAPEQEQVHPYDAPGPWSEEDWLALPESTRVELVDGALVVNSAPRNRHQRLALRIGATLDGAATGGWDVLNDANIRLGPDRAVIPDVVVLREADMDALINDAVDVGLIVEIVSPSNAAYDRILKPRLYAEAGIVRYLRVEHGPGGAI
ncbi:MAG: hypothetical protein AVDCRST_MAG54-2549, partial [uncultured Actinomycetospora sp.]